MVRAYVKSYADKASIFVVGCNTFCWRRFLIAKEICHLLCQSPENSTSSAEHVEQVLNGLINGNFGTSPDPAVLMEDAAYAGAIELLLPREFEQHAQERIRQGSGLLDIATAFFVPERVVEFRYGEGKKLFEEIYADPAYSAMEFAAVMPG